jgi:hypothetical protein
MLQEKPSAPERGHPARQNIKFLIFIFIYVDYLCTPGSGSCKQLNNQRGIFLDFFIEEDTGIESRTVATTALTVRQSDALTTRLDLIHKIK